MNCWEMIEITLIFKEKVERGEMDEADALKTIKERRNEFGFNWDGNLL